MSAEWNVQRNRNVPAPRNRLLTADPTGNDSWNDQFPPYAPMSWNPLTPFHLTVVPRATVIVDGDQRVPIPRTSTGLACAVAASVTTSTEAHTLAATPTHHLCIDPCIDPVTARPYLILHRTNRPPFARLRVVANDP
jgi:hypothetical protein